MSESHRTELNSTRTFGAGTMVCILLSVAHYALDAPSGSHTVAFALAALAFGYLTYWAWFKDGTAFFGIVWGLFTVGTAAVVLGSVL